MRPARLLGVAVACLLTLAGCGSHHAASHARAQSALGSVAPAGWGQASPGLTLAPSATAPGGATVEMLDTIDPAQLHGLHPAAVAGYLQGRWPDYLSLVRLFPAAHHVAVSVFATPVYPSTARMACLDVEPGDAVPSQAGPWARGELGLGVTPCLYSSLSEMPAVRASLAAAGVARSRVLLWLAWYRFRPGLVEGYDATQWTDRADGRNIDESTVSLAFLGVHAQPATVRCFTHRLTPAKCRAARARVAADERAAASSQRAYVVRGCRVLAQREAWFAAQLRRHPHVRTARRRRALAATRTAYRREACSVFAQRAAWFTAAAARMKAAS